MLVEYESGSPQTLPKSLKQATTTTEERSHGSPNLPTFCPLFPNVSLLLPCSGIAKHRENTNAPQRNLNFCPFSAPFTLIWGYLGAPDSQELPRWVQVRPMLLANQAGATRERGKGKERQAPTRQANKERNERKSRSNPASPQAHKKRVPPPYCRGQAAVPLHKNSRQKISKKVALGSFEKIFGKIFRWNVSVERKPLAFLNGRGF